MCVASFQFHVTSGLRRRERVEAVGHHAAGRGGRHQDRGECAGEEQHSRRGRGAVRRREGHWTATG